MKYLKYLIALFAVLIVIALVPGSNVIAQGETATPTPTDTPAPTSTPTATPTPPPTLAPFVFDTGSFATLAQDVLGGISPIVLIVVIGALVITIVIFLARSMGDIFR